MRVQKDLRLAKRAMARSPTDGVLACLSLMARGGADAAAARKLLKSMGAAARREVLNDVMRLDAAGDHRTALRILMPLGKVHPADAPLAEQEARCWMATGGFDRMAERLALPLATNPDHAGLLTATGVAEFGLGRADAALAHLERAARLRPFDPHVHNHLGGVLLALGQVGAARAAFRTAVTEGGGVPEAWPNLANLVDFAAEPELARRLDRLGPGAARTPEQQECLAFARAKSAFDRGQANDAFQHLHRANALHRARVAYNGAHHRRETLALIDRLPAGRVLPESARPRVVLVVGMPRSGTTLMERILDAHPQVAGLGERPDLARLIARIDTGTSWTRAQLATLAGRYRAALAAADPSGAPVVVDKMPGNALLAGFALAALPDAQVIHMRRDPVATGFSCYRRRFTNGTEFAFDLADIAERSRLTDSVMRHWRARFADRVHDVVYEHLVDCPAETIGAALDRIGLPPDPACLTFAGAKGDVRTASSAQVRAPVTRQKSADWRHFAEHLAPLVEALGDLPARHEAFCAAIPGTVTRPAAPAA